MKQAAFITQARARQIPGQNSFMTWLAGFACLLAGTYAILHGLYIYFITMAVLGSLLVLWKANRTAALAAMFAFLILIGDIRRISNALFSTAFLDPLLLVSSIFCLYLVLPIFIRLRVRDNLSKLVLALMGVMALEVVNPQQGSLLVGFAGALFFIVPLFWYWVGRRYATERMIYVLLFQVLLPLSILGSIMGIYQTYEGPLPWQQEWADTVGKGIGFDLGGGHIRSFGFSVGALDYASLLMIGTVCVLAAVMSKRRAYALLWLCLIPASVLSSARGPIVKMLFAAAVLWAVHSRNSKVWLPRFIFALVFGVGGLFYGLKHSSVSDTSATELQHADTATRAENRIVVGLTDKNRSSAGQHSEMVASGFSAGFKNPLGLGLGSTTLAHTKFGGDGASSEIDVSDLFISCGFVGGSIYIAIIIMTAMRVARYRKEHGGILALSIIGTLAVMIGTWFAQDQYAMQFLMFFIIGFVSREAQPDGAKSRQAALPSTNRLAATV
jgi:hypothetical protein